MKTIKKRTALLAGPIYMLFAFSPYAFSAPSDVEAVLKSFLNGKRPAEDMSLVYEAGRQYFGGHITLSISGDRTVKLQFSRDEQQKNFQGLLDKDGVSRLIKTMLEDNFWTARASEGKRVPDAAEIEIRLSTKQNDLDFRLICLETEALKSKELQTLVVIFKGIVKAVSDGEVEDY